MGAIGTEKISGHDAKRVAKVTLAVWRASSICSDLRGICTRRFGSISILDLVASGGSCKSKTCKGTSTVARTGRRKPSFGAEPGSHGDADFGRLPGTVSRRRGGG